MFWDEMPHLNGGWLLSQGKFEQYLTSTRYPPLMDIFIALSFKIFGSSVFSGRLVSVIFAVLTLGVFYKLVSKAYGKKIALLSSLIFATMPAYVYLARVSFLEMILEFFFIATIWLFYSWLKTGKSLAILLAGVALGLGFLAKYQVIVAALVIIVSLPLLLYKNTKFKIKISRFLLFLVVASAIILPFFLQIYYSGVINQWMTGLLGMVDTHAEVYSARFPMPIFYILESINPIPTVYPISILVVGLGLLGLGFFAWRRKPEDKLFIVWFIVVYVFFSLVGTKSWRYVVPFYPVLAVSSASLIAHFYEAIKIRMKQIDLKLGRKRKLQVASGFLIAITASAVAYNVYDSVTWISAFANYVPIPEALRYMSKDLPANDSIMIACALNVFNDQMLKFYLNAYELKDNKVLQYPSLPADVYVPTFNQTEFVSICLQNNVKYVIVFEAWDKPYFDTELNAGRTSDLVVKTGHFNYTTFVGNPTNRIFIFTANQTALNP
jgi:hypothetical protein